jgi:uncharacterized protein (TIGR03435 family)
MFRAFGITGLATLFSSLAVAQPATLAALSFEVANVKKSKPGGTPNGEFLPGGKLVLRYLTRKEMITAAWELDRWPERVAGGPDWLNSGHYDIVAKAASSTPEKELRITLSNLLIKHFKLETHMEKKPMPVYALVVGRQGKLQESTAADVERNSCKVQTPQQRKDGQMIRSRVYRSAGGQPHGTRGAVRFHARLDSPAAAAVAARRRAMPGEPGGSERRRPRPIRAGSPSSMPCRVSWD